MADTAKRVRPQEGFQMNFLSSPADIVIGGSAAGVGKTYALLLEYLRYHKVPGFGGTIFRRTSPQIRLEGGLWDTSVKIYPHLGARPRESSLEWLFPAGTKLKFAHLEYEKNKLDYQGAQIPFIGFDELTHFTETMFFYLLSRNRSVCGVKPYVRATCNPDPESWVAKLIAWWIDQKTGYPIPERDGVVRYFIRFGETYIWGDSKAEVIEQGQHIIKGMLAKAEEEAKRQGKKSVIKAEDFVKSLTFISGSIYQNMELLKVDPSYLANLLSQDEATRRSLLDSNWKYAKSDKDIYDFDSFQGMFDNVYDVRDKTRKRITADIALLGSNKFIVSYFEGRSLEDMTIMDKSNGKEVVDTIKAMARKHGVPNKNILFDADGVGGYVDGYLKGAKAFHGGNKAKKVWNSINEKYDQEDYFNLKTQLIYRAGSSVNKNLYRVSDRVKKMRYSESMNVEERMVYERKAFKRDKKDHDGKLKVIPKQEMKILLQGESPDIMDTFFMNEFFEIETKPTSHATAEDEMRSLGW